MPIKDRNPLEEIMTPSAPAPDDAESLMTQFLRGFMNTYSTVGEQPRPELFNEKFRQSTSPAREILANIFYGASAGLTGQKFRSARERAYEEFQDQQKTALEQQQMKMNYMHGVAQIAAQMVNQRRIERMHRDIEQIRMEQDAAKREDQWNQFIARYNLDISKFIDAKEARERAADRPKDAFFDLGYQEAQDEFRQAGKDPFAKENGLALHQRAVEIGNQIWETRQKLQSKYSTAFALRPRLESVKITNPWGELEFGTREAMSGSFINAPPWWGPDTPPRDFGPEAQRRFALTQTAIDAMRQATRVVANSSPGEAVGEFEKSVPPPIRSLFTSVPASERNLRVLFNAAMSQYILGMSGVATSAREEQRLSNGLPKFFERPSNWVPGALAFTNMLEGTLLRQQAGIDPNELDMGELFNDYLTRLQKHLQDAEKKGKVGKFTTPTGYDFLKQAAKEKGYTLIYDSKGRVRGMTKNAGR